VVRRREKQGNQARLAILSRGLLLARPPQPYGVENSYGNVQNAVTDWTAIFHRGKTGFRERIA
jgi:hypothetical protein